MKSSLEQFNEFLTQLFNTESTIMSKDIQKESKGKEPKNKDGKADKIPAYKRGGQVGYGIPGGPKKSK